MNSAFPDADIKNYADLKEGIVLPDKDNRRVLAAAIRGNADVIVTCYLKDFPSENLKKYDIEAQHPDKFVSNLISPDKAKCMRALSNQVKSLKNPPMPRNEVLEILKSCGLVKSVIQLKE
jgi:hypothetical protein